MSELADAELQRNGQDTLLATKLYAPRARKGLVARPRLVQRLAEALEGPLTLVSAPAGCGKTKQVVISVKAGNLIASYVRDLHGVVDREHAEIGVLISMQEPTHHMTVEAMSAGVYYSPTWNENYPRLQLLTVAELLAGKKIAMPPRGQVDTTFKKAPKAKGEETKTLSMPLR
jgi:hypothetical protein